MTGSLLLTGAERPAVGFRAQAIGFSDSRTGMQGRSVWTDERGDMVYSELKGEFVGTGNQIAGTFIGGTGRYAGVTGDYSFRWQYVIDAEDGAVSGRVVDFKGRARLGQAATRACQEGQPDECSRCRLPPAGKTSPLIRPGARHLVRADPGRADEGGLAPFRRFRGARSSRSS